MHRVLLIDSRSVYAGAEVPTLGAYVEKVLDLYEYFVPARLGFARTAEPLEPAEALLYAWEQAITRNTWRVAEFEVLDVFYTLSAQLCQEQTLQNAHPAPAESAPGLARPQFPYDLEPAPAKVTWQTLLYTHQSIPKEIFDIPGVRVHPPVVISDHSTAPRIVPRISLRDSLDFTASRSLLADQGCTLLLSRLDRLPGSIKGAPENLF